MSHEYVDKDCEFPNVIFMSELRQQSLRRLRELCELEKQFECDGFSSFGPAGFPILIGAYFVFERRKHKERADRKLAKSNLGVLKRDNPMTNHRHYTYFMRPDAEWKAELDPIELLKVMTGVRK